MLKKKILIGEGKKCNDVNSKGKNLRTHTKEKTIQES
jgi:hypothetical protein